MTVGRPVWLAGGGLLTVVVGLIGWGLAVRVPDRAHAFSLVGAKPCPAPTQITLPPTHFCTASRDVTDGELSMIGHDPCACDGPGSPLQIGTRTITFGSLAWAGCVTRGPALVMRSTPGQAIVHFQIPGGWTGFARSDGPTQRCWMLPNARIDSDSGARLLGRVQWPNLDRPD